LNSVFKWAHYCFNSVSDQEYSGPYQGKNLNSELIANPGFIPVPPQFNPYAMMYQQQPKFSNGWSYFFGYPDSLINPAAAPSQRQFDEDDEEFKQDFKDEVVKQGANPTPVPACGTGPSIFPTTKQLLASERVTGVGAIKAKKGAWPFMVSLNFENRSSSSATLITAFWPLFFQQLTKRLVNIYSFFFLILFKNYYEHPTHFPHYTF
jgi:hypothetical protein